MKKNLLIITASDIIIERVGKLAPNSKPLWGEMAASEMLMHCNSCNKQILEEEREDKEQLLNNTVENLALYYCTKLCERIKDGKQA